MSKKDVWKLINKRKQRSQRFKKRKFNNPNSIVAEFIMKFEEALETIKSAEAFYFELEMANKDLESKMMFLDPDVKLKIMWNNEDKLSQHDTWQELRIEGVHIMWSQWYLGKHPFNEREMYIDISQLFLEGYLD